MDTQALQNAIRLAQAQLENAERNQQEKETVQLLGYLGNACRITGLGEMSVAYLERAVRLCRRLGLRKAELANTIRLAEALKYKGDHAETERILRTALNWTDEDELSNHRDFVLQHLGKCRLEQGDSDEAIALLEEALKIRLSKGEPSLLESTERALRLAQNTSSRR